MTETADIALGHGRRRPLVAKLREEDGIGLIELMMALLVLNVGIFATIAAFSSGALTLRRASHTSTAAAIADRYFQCMRDSSYTNITWPMTTGSCTATTVTGADGLTYTISGTVTTASQLTTGTYKGSSAVKQVTLTVKGPSPSTQVLDTSTSTFSLCTQSALGTETNPCQT